MIRRTAFLFIYFLSSSIISAESDVSINTVNNSNIIIGDNNIQNIHYTMKDNGVDAHLDVTEDKIIHKMELFPDGNTGCSFYKKTEQYIFPDLRGCVSDNEDYLYNYIVYSKAFSFNSAYLPWSFNIKSPIFDLRIINNKDKSISIKKLRINVEKSRAYREPIVFLWHNDLTQMGLTLNNEGNTSITEIETNYSFSNKMGYKDSKYKYYKKFTYTENDSINKKTTDYTVLDFSESLKLEGIDVDFLKSEAVSDLYIGNVEHESEILRQNILNALGNYTDGYPNDSRISRTEFYAFIYGTMKIKGLYQDTPVEKNIDFEGKIALTIPMHAYGDLFVGQAYDVQLKNNGDNYNIDLETSKYIKPFEAEKFLLRIVSIESGFHSFSIDVIFSDDSFARSNKITFFNWSPRSKQKELTPSEQDNYSDLVEQTIRSSQRLKVVNVASDDVLHVRADPNRNSKSIHELAYDANNIIPSNKTKLVDGTIWIKIHTDSFNKFKEGWVNSKYLAYDK